MLIRLRNGSTRTKCNGRSEQDRVVSLSALKDHHRKAELNYIDVWQIVQNDATIVILRRTEQEV